MAQVYGLFTLIDLERLNPNAPIVTVQSDLLVSGILIDNAQHNRDLNALVNNFAVTRQDAQLEYRNMAGGRNQPLDENGRSIPVQPPAPYTVGFPLVASGTARGWNYITGKLITVQDLAETLSGFYIGDFNWVIDHVFAALFNNTSYSFTDRFTRHGAVTVQPLANGDGTLYYRQTTGQTATDTHLLAQAAAIDDSHNPYLTIRDRIIEHPDNQGGVICFVPTNLIAATEALTDFNLVRDPAVQPATSSPQLVGQLDITVPPGAIFRGKLSSGPWIYEWPKLPDNYIVGISERGPRPLLRRQLPEATLQGFGPAGQRDDYPYFEDQWLRIEGYGVWNRVGAVVYQIGSASYAVPTNYTSPMP